MLLTVRKQTSIASRLPWNTRMPCHLICASRQQRGQGYRPSLASIFSLRENLFSSIPITMRQRWKEQPSQTHAEGLSCELPFLLANDPSESLPAVGLGAGRA